MASMPTKLYDFTAPKANEPIIATSIKLRRASYFGLDENCDGNRVTRSSSSVDQCKSSSTNSTSWSMVLLLADVYWSISSSVASDLVPVSARHSNAVCWTVVPDMCG